MAAPRKIVPLRRPVAFADAVAIAPTAHLTYHGGPLLSSVQVVTIFWGMEWQQPAQSVLIPQLNQFFEFILTSSLIDLLGQYGVLGYPIGHGQRVGTATLASPEPGGGSGQLADADLQQALQGWISAGTIPPASADTLYFVYLPPGVALQFQSSLSCQAFCGYHSHIDGNPPIYYAAEPFLNCPGCTYGQMLDSLSKVSSHELCEAITDPSGDGWYDEGSGDEIGDICNASVAKLGGFTVQTEWSDRSNACVLAPQPALLGDHFYTTDPGEAQSALANLGYQYEGVAAFVFSAPQVEAVPFYRLLFPPLGTHFYTTNAAERDNAVNTLGYQEEGVACYVFTSAVANATPLYRLYSPTQGYHFYTIEAAERDHATQQLGYQDEGIACYVFGSEAAATTPFYRLLR